MKTKGIRIEDSINNVITVKLQDILEEIQNGDLLQWSILYFYGTGTLRDGKSMMVFEEEVNKSEKGLFVKWNELNELANNFYDIWDILIVGCKAEQLIFRYKLDQELYEACDIVIEMVDSSFWEIFANDISLIKRLSVKFKDVKLLESDFEK